MASELNDLIIHKYVQSTNDNTTQFDRDEASYAEQPYESVDHEKPQLIDGGVNIFPHNVNTSHRHLHSRSPNNNTLTFSPLHLPLPPESPLFEPMDSDTNPDTPSPPSALPSSSPPILDGLKRARALKAELSGSLTVLQAKSKIMNRSRRVEDDPENQLIKRLRQHDKMGWDAIANYLNEERLKRGEPGNFTQPAVYSRFVRNAPRIAAALGEVGFDPKDYMHLRNPNSYPSSDPSAISTPRAAGRPRNDFGFGTGVTKKRVRQPGNEEQELKGSIRPKGSLSDQAKELEEEGMTEMLIEAVAMVERNFWIFVADELERTTSRLYDGKVCESRFHAI